MGQRAGFDTTSARSAVCVTDRGRTGVDKFMKSILKTTIEAVLFFLVTSALCGSIWLLIRMLF